MANFGSKDIGFVLVNGFDLTGSLPGGLEDNGIEAVLDGVTSLGDAWPEYADTGSAKGLGLKLGALYDDAANATGDCFVEKQGLARVICWAVGGNIIGRRFQGYAGPIGQKVQRIMADGKLHRVNVDYAGSGPSEEGVILHAHTQEAAASGNTQASSHNWAGEARARSARIVSSSVANPSILETSEPHGLSDRSAVSAVVGASGGTGYAVGDALSVVGGTKTVAARFRVATLGALNAVATVTLIDGGHYTVVPANDVATTVTPAGGAACVLTVTWNAAGDTVVLAGHVADLAPVAPTLALGIPGLVTNGAHEVYVTLVKGATETDPSPVASIVVTDNKKIELTNVVVGNASIGDRNIYVTKAGETGAANAHLVGAVGDNTTVVYSFNVADAGLAGAAPPTTNGTLTTPDINGKQVATVIDATHFSVAVNVTAGGESGTVTQASTPDGGAGYIECSQLALGGYDSLLAKVKHSDDNAAFVDLIAFTAITAAPASERKTVSGTIYQYTASSWAYGGAGAGQTATFMVGLTRNADV